LPFIAEPQQTLTFFLGLAVQEETGIGTTKWIAERKEKKCDEQKPSLVPGAASSLPSFFLPQSPLTSLTSAQPHKAPRSVFNEFLSFSEFVLSFLRLSFYFLV
jgi:hypothetical protein